MLSYLPSFLAKNKTPHNYHPRVQLSAIPCAAISEERFLCPVRALLNLRSVIRSRTNPCANLFQTLEGQTVSARRLSALMVEVIKDAHRTLDDEGARLLRIKCHDVRAVAASQLWLRTSDRDTVSSAFSWNNKSTFIAHYA